MADCSWRNIEDIKPGDYVIGIEGAPLKVLANYATNIGYYQALWTFPDGSLKWTSEHAFWVRKDGLQYWGTHDIHHWRRGEHEFGPHFVGELLVNFGVLPREPMILTGGEDYAHIDGWRTQRPIMCREEVDPEKYLVWQTITEKSHTMIVNGYVVSAYISDTNGEYDYSNIDWKGLNHGG